MLTLYRSFDHIRPKRSSCFPLRCGRWKHHHYSSWLVRASPFITNWSLCVFFRYRTYSKSLSLRCPWWIPRFPPLQMSSHQLQATNRKLIRLLGRHIAIILRYDRTPDSTLINGLGRYKGGPTSPLAVVNVTYGTRYRFRLIGMSCTPNYVFSIDSHMLNVIEVDGVCTPNSAAVRGLTFTSPEQCYSSDGGFYPSLRRPTVFLYCKFFFSLRHSWTLILTWTYSWLQTNLLETTVSVFGAFSAALSR